MRLGAILNRNDRRRHLRLPRTAGEAVHVDALSRARRLLVDLGEPGREGFTREEVIIAGLLQLHDAQQARANRHAEELARVRSSQFRNKFVARLREKYLKGV